MKNYYGGIEAGGTKFVCVIANNPTDILEEIRFPTTNPQETIEKVISFFHQAVQRHKINLISLGIGCFGPIDLDPSSRGFERPNRIRDRCKCCRTWRREMGRSSKLG